MFSICLSFIYTNTATTEIYTLSLHDALPIWPAALSQRGDVPLRWIDAEVIFIARLDSHGDAADRKSTRLNSSHLGISYAVFCLKKKMKRSARTHVFIIDVQL